jgi:hypothetical protein
MSSFSTLWIGPGLSLCEKVSLSSFLYYGHEIKIYLYDMDLKVPSGIKKYNANDILPKEKIFFVENSPAVFADLFRYKMIKDTGDCWVDTDIICLGADWNFGEYTYGYEDLYYVANSILKLPKNSNIVDDLYQQSMEIIKYNDKNAWGDTGPHLLTKLLKKHDLEGYARDIKTFYPINYTEWDKIWNPRYLTEVLDQTKDSKSLQLWNQYLTRNKVNKNSLPKGSAIKYFASKFLYDKL